MSRLCLVMLLATVLGAAAPEEPFDPIDPIQKPMCIPELYSGFGYHDCLDGLWLATSIWAGECDTGCPYIFTLTMEVDEDCDDDQWQHQQEVGVLPCGGWINVRFNFMGDTVAWASAICHDCEQVVVPVEPTGH